jgi:hypothetical protein
MPKIISGVQELLYLRTLAETGNATLAAACAGVSKSWAYARRKVDAEFDHWFRAMIVLFRESPPLPTLSREGRGVNRRTRVNRDRKGGWTAEKEAEFLQRLEETCSVRVAAAAVGHSASSAHHRRRVRPDFGEQWDEAQRRGWPPVDHPWIESMLCFFEGRDPPPDNPVRIRSVGEVIDGLEGKRFFVRPLRKKRSRG